MSISRRGFVAMGSLAGAGLIAAHVAGEAVVGQETTALFRLRPRRRSLKGMAATDPIILAWREAVRKMKEPGMASPFKWAELATIHGTSAGFNKCPHRNWYFLPWHRGYLTMYERKVRELTSFPQFALPYWDWTNEPTLPPAFTAATINGQPNALFETRTLSGTLSPTIVGPSVITQILGEAPYEKFGTSRPTGQNDLSQSWINTGTGLQGTLEGTPHNLVHGQVGGVMGGFRSALDPIFMMHHCNIDRLWAVWRAAGHPNSADPLWTDMPFTNHFFNNDGSPWSPKVSDMFVPENLGYTYRLRVLPILTRIPKRWERFERFFTVPVDQPIEGVERFAAAVNQPATMARPLAAPVKVRPEALRPMMGRGAAGAGEAMLDVVASAGDEAEMPRTVVILRNIAVTNAVGTEFRVFLNQGTLAASTATSSPNYVGTFGFFGGAHQGHAGEKPSVMLDLTDAIGRVFAEGASPDQLTVQIQPVGRAGAAAEAVGTATPERIEIVVVS